MRLPTDDIVRKNIDKFSPAAYFVPNGQYNSIEVPD